LNGHDHHYERVVDGNLTSLILGGGGALQDPYVVPIPETQKVDFGPNFALFNVNSTGLNVEIRTLEDRIIDSIVFPAGGVI
jgi:hypothetical protein